MQYHPQQTDQRHPPRRKKLVEFKVVMKLQLLVDHIVYVTVETGCVNTQIVPNVRKEQPDFALLMEVVGVVLFQDVTKVLETSSFVLHMEEVNVVLIKVATSLLWVVQIYAQATVEGNDAQLMDASSLLKVQLNFV